MISATEGRCESSSLDHCGRIGATVGARFSDPFRGQCVAELKHSPLLLSRQVVPGFLERSHQRRLIALFMGENDRLFEQVGIHHLSNRRAHCPKDFSEVAPRHSRPERRIGVAARVVFVRLPIGKRFHVDDRPLEACVYSVDFPGGRCGPAAVDTTNVYLPFSSVRYGAGREGDI